ncbi:bifunctional helix-turn-helix transcriptional regulator/GNAT family N-acetyltransferase [Vannielia litorea]|uniref:bifunctional helix-turn-helix transcriptional regulator/GNAT family N-acetyltransferase n=1 Tax=Vannielia litorea TaxID=1217970 RepID=UPI001BCCD85E|nr:helix-turn-helix domain-containing GNAT family N-acetyltransferase [Vannielia litorea]MBS8227271.1 MarR family transcriptional regulator [Vannielia litorea]
MDDIEALRDFSRFYTQRLGLLGQSYLGSGLGVTEVRVLWELAFGAQGSAREIAERLGLDEGYLSRLLAGFEKKGWIVRAPDPEDARRRLLRLTGEGKALAASHDKASRAAVGGFLGQMSPDARALLGDGLARVKQAFNPPEACELKDLAPGDAGWIVERHGLLYARDEGYDATFEALVAEIMADFLRSHDPARESGWIAWGGGRRLGSVFCVSRGEETAQLRLFFLEPEARGLGLGRMMLDACLTFARDKGYRELVLWTHESHAAACRLYDKAGFERIGRRAAQEFGQDTVIIDYRIDL